MGWHGFCASCQRNGDPDSLIRRGDLATVICLLKDTHVTATVERGEAIQVEVEDISTTGYQWSVVNVDQSVIVLKDERVHCGTVPGASGTKIFDFVTIKAGEVTLHFVLRRPWERERPSLREVTLDLKIK